MDESKKLEMEANKNKKLAEKGMNYLKKISLRV